LREARKPPRSGGLDGEFDIHVQTISLRRRRRKGRRDETADKRDACVTG
jgi:hypothetical protein